jgi:hypothetical protein
MMQFLEEEELFRRQAHNEDLEAPEVLKNGAILDHDVIVKLFYFDVVTTTENGIVELKYRIEESDGGRAIAAIDDEPFQPRGVVVKVGSKVEGLKVGQIVWLNHRVAYNPLFDFLLDRTVPVAKPTGYKKINQNQIEFIEQTN